MLSAHLPLLVMALDKQFWEHGGRSANDWAAARPAKAARVTVNFIMNDLKIAERLE